MLNGEYDVKTYRSMDEFYDAIPSKLYDGVNNSPFQFKNWQELLYREFFEQKRPGKYIGAILFVNKEPFVGGHFFNKHSGKMKGLFILGSGGDTDYNDLIWFKKDIETVHIEHLVNYMLDITKQNKFWASQILKESLLCSWATEYGADHIKSNPCAHILINGTFDEYWKSLKKGVRQNIRTAQNRINTDNKTFEIISFEDEVIPEEVIKKYHTIYENRRITKNGQLSIKEKFYEFRRKKLKNKFNLATEAMRNVKNILSSYIIIDGIVAGYFYGIKDNCGRVCLMHVAVCDEFARYSPGMILLSKSLEKIYERREIKNFDLSNGDEGYKLSLGAVLHSTEYYCYTRERR